MKSQNSSYLYKYKLAYLITITSFFLLLVFSYVACSVETPFNYDPDKIEPGTMYVYQFSTNPKKFDAESKFLVYYSKNSSESGIIETLRMDRKDPTEAYYYRFQMNWNYMILEESRYKYLGPKEEFSMGSSWEARTETDFNRRELKMNDIHLTEEGREVRTATRKFSHFPTFFYFTLHVDAWTAMRFYTFPKKTPELWNYTGTKLNKVKVKYQGKETVEVPAGKILAYKFQFSGKGLLAWLFGKKAWLWLSAEDERNYMVRYENNNPRGHKPKIEFQLEEVKKVSQEEWGEKIERWNRKRK